MNDLKRIILVDEIRKNLCPICSRESGCHIPEEKVTTALFARYWTTEELRDKHCQFYSNKNSQIIPKYKNDVNYENKISNAF